MCLHNSNSATSVNSKPHVVGQMLCSRGTLPLSLGLHTGVLKEKDKGVLLMVTAGKEGATLCCVLKVQSGVGLRNSSNMVAANQSSPLPHSGLPCSWHHLLKSVPCMLGQCTWVGVSTT